MAQFAETRCFALRNLKSIVAKDGESYDSYMRCLVFLVPVHPLRAGLVGYWPFDGDVSDQSGVANDGELVGGTFVDTVPAALGGGQALSFEDPTEHVLIPANSSLNSSVFTLTMFVNDQGQFSNINRFTSRASDTRSKQASTWRLERSPFPITARVPAG